MTIDIYNSTYYSLTVTSASPVYSVALPSGWYEVFAKNSDIYVKSIKSGDAEGNFTQHHPLWAGNSEIFYVHEQGKLGFVCKVGELNTTVEFIQVRIP